MRRLAAATFILGLYAAPVLGQGAAPTLTRIGAAAAVQGRVSAQAPGAAVGRIVESGKPLFLNDHVTTDAAGRLQVLLLDETVFTVGPNSDMLLDQFVYDPRTGAGRVAARVTKGIFRFVTGKIARRDPSNMKVALPAGTVGIRGTMAIGEVTEELSRVILLGPGGRGNSDESRGAITFESQGVKRFIDEPGYGVTARAGEPPSSVQNLSEVAGHLSARLSPTAAPSAASAATTERSVAKQSGEETAAARTDTQAVLVELASAEDNSRLLTQAQQDAASSVVDGLTTWEFIRQQLSTGQGVYFNGHTKVVCAGCASNMPEGSLQLQVDFAARTLGGQGTDLTGGGSFIHIHGVDTPDNTDTIEQTINKIDFSALSGNAKVLLDPYLNAATGGNGDFHGTTIKLENSGNTVAKDAVADLQFQGQTVTGTQVRAIGTVTAPR